MKSTHEAELDLPMLPPAARHIHIVPALASSSLISMGQLCDAGCTIAFTATEVTVSVNDAIVLIGHRTPDTRLWHFPLPTSAPTPSMCHSAMASIGSATPSDLVAFAHAALFSPTLSTLNLALTKGFITHFPGLTPTLLRKYPPHSAATIKGHMDQARQNQRSTKQKPTNIAPPPGFPSKVVPDTAPDDCFPASTTPNDRTHMCYAAMMEPTGKVFSDQTGRFVIPSSIGNNYLIIVYDYDSNSILAEPIKSRSGAAILAGYQAIHSKLYAAGLRPRLQRLDNECSEPLKEFLNKETIDFQLAPPGIHRRNAAERAIRTFKNHFIAGLCSVDKDFPLHLWDRLVPQALLTLNLLRGSRVNPKLSAWAQLNGQFDFNRTPIAPPGIRVLVHEKPNNRTTWSPHASDGWYIGPALDSYRCYTVWMCETRATRISDTLSWFPTKVTMPLASSTDLILAALHDITNALQNPSPGSPLAPVTDSHVAALKTMTDVLTGLCPDAPIATASPPMLVQPPTNSPLLRVAAPPPAPSPPSVPPTPPPQPAPLRSALRVVGSPKPTTHVHFTTPLTPQAPTPPLSTDTEPTYANTTGPTGRRRRRLPRQRINTARAQAKTNVATEKRQRQTARIASKVKRTVNRAAKTATRQTAATRAAAETRRRTDKADSRNLRKAILSSPKTTGSLPIHQHFTRSNRKKTHVAAATAIAPANDAPLPFLDHFALHGNAFNPDTGQLAEYLELSKCSEGALWIESCKDEFGRLCQGHGLDMPTGTNTMFFIPKSAIPKHKKATYLRIVAAHRPEKQNPRRVRFTAGGNQIDYAGDVSTKTADLTTVKTFFNSVISTPKARFMTADLKDFYLETPMEEFEYMRIPVAIIPDSIMTEYKLAPLVDHDHVYVEIQKGMYGLPQAGRLANDRLIAFLAPKGYAPVPITHGLWKHNASDLMFTLVVDDFGIKFTNTADAEHLMTTLKELYTVSEDWDGAKYCGLTLNWDYTNRTVDISIPGYIERALQRFQHPTPSRPEHAPHAWQKPIYGAKTQYAPGPDSAPAIDATDTKRLQEVLGTLLFYARAVDSTMLPTISTLASQQAHGTTATMEALTQLLNYCASHPDATIRYYASDMMLYVHSDASYLTAPKARSRVAGYHYLSDFPHDPSKAPKPNDPLPPPNGAINVLCQILREVVSSAAEAEVAGVYHNGREACPLRICLEELGHPQPPTPIQTDNSTAAGIANDTVKQKRSKAIDMRFYWIRDRVRQGQFHVYWKRGSLNKADYFTKHHPASHHQDIRSSYLHSSDDRSKNYFAVLQDEITNSSS
jgi:hypothetical protein